MNVRKVDGPSMTPRNTHVVVARKGSSDQRTPEKYGLEPESVRERLFARRPELIAWAETGGDADSSRYSGDRVCERPYVDSRRLALTLPLL